MMKSFTSFALVLCLSSCLVAFSSAFQHTHTDFASASASSSASPFTLDSLPPNWESSIDSYIQNITRCQGVIGLSVSVVFANQSIYAKGFGTTTLGGSQAVDANTLFSIGSTTKAFTSTLLAMLVDEGFFPQGWDTKVTSIAKDFQFYSSVESQFLSIRDLLSMKAGISLQPLLMFRNGTRRDAIYKFQYAPPAMEMRTEFLYANWMIALAGHLAEIVTGQSWESLIQTRILDPLGMKTSTPIFADVYETDNWAMPYGWSVDGSNKWVPLNEINTDFQMVAPAGSMSTTANDVANWLLLHLNQGSLANSTTSLVSPTNLGVSHAPQFLMQQSPFPRTLPVNPLSNANMGYGFGWMKDSLEGREIYWHNGEVFGFTSEMAFMPNEGVGVFTSQTGSYIGEISLFAIRVFIINTLLGLDTSFLSRVCPTEPHHSTDVAAMMRERFSGTHFDTTQSKLVHHGARPIVPHTGKENVRLAKGVERFNHKKHAPHHHQLHASHHAKLDTTVYMGTYENIIYDQLLIAAVSESDAKSMFPTHPSTSSPITLLLIWEVLTMGLNDLGDGIHFNCTLAAPYNLVLPPVWQDGAIFLKDGSGNVNGLYWLVDSYAPPQFNKTS